MRPTLSYFVLNVTKVIDKRGCYLSQFFLETIYMQHALMLRKKKCKGMGVTVNSQTIFQSAETADFISQLQSKELSVECSLGKLSLPTMTSSLITDNYKTSEIMNNCMYSILVLNIM